MSDQAAAPVVDSSPISQFIQDSGLAPPSSTAAQTAAPAVDQAAVAEFTASLPPKVDTAAPVAAGATTTDADRISQLGQSVGMDLSGFTDLKSAQAAVNLISDQMMQLGLSGQTQQFGLQQPLAQQSQTTATSTQVAAIPELPDTVDPAIRDAFKALAGQVQTYQKQIADTAAAQQAQQTQAVWSEINRRGEAAINALNSDKYGTAAARSPMQMIAARNVLQAAIAMGQGFINAGRQSPQIETLINLVAMRDGHTPGVQAAQSQQKAATPFALPPTTPGTGQPNLGGVKLPRVASSNDPFGDFKDPTVRAIFAEALKRN